jgi:hypothetical protein
MSTDIIKVDPGAYLALKQEPGFIQGNLADGEEVDEFSLPRVKIPAGGATTWEVPTLAGVTPMRELEGVVVHFKHTRAYWPDDAETGTPPVCRSHDAITGIGDPGGPCKTCPLSKFKSASDGVGQACGMKEIWFVLRAETFLPLVLSLPPMSLKAAKDYRFGQLGSAGVQLSSVVTARATGTAGRSRSSPGCSTRRTPPPPASTPPRCATCSRRPPPPRPPSTVPVSRTVGPR